MLWAALAFIMSKNKSSNDAVENVRDSVKEFVEQVKEDFNEVMSEFGIKSPAIPDNGDELSATKEPVRRSAESRRDDEVRYEPQKIEEKWSATWAADNTLYAAE